MKFTCWRCKHEVERTAAECPGCGKALAPVPWLRKPWLGPRRWTDAVVVDYVRRVMPFTSVLVALIFVLSLLVGAWGGIGSWGG